jgi:hypothetical protein
MPTGTGMNQLCGDELEQAPIIGAMRIAIFDLIGN